MKIPKFFYAPDAATGGGDGEIKTPFDDINLDDLDDESRTKITKAKENFVANARELSETKTKLETGSRTSAELEKTVRELQIKLQGAARTGDSANQDQYLATIRGELEKAGFKPEQIDAMAPMWRNILKNTGDIIKKEIGTDLAPFAASTIAREAEAAFTAVAHDDPLGLLQDPNVAQTVWDSVRDRADRGLATNQDIVRNLARMAYMDQVEGKRRKGEDVSAMIQKITTGQGVSGSGQRPSNNPGNRTTGDLPALNEDTKSALAETFRKMDPTGKLVPKEFKPVPKSKTKTVAA